MELQTRNPITVERNHEVSTFFFRLLVDGGVGCAYDFDGIFCEECPSSGKGSDEAYYTFLCTANPLFYPHKGHVDLIITGRHHKYRDVTDKWLKRNNISYGQMIMRDFDIDPKDTATPIAEFKASVYGKLPDYTLFVESRLKQAKLIHERTGKDVFCPVKRTFLTKS